VQKSVTIKSDETQSHCGKSDNITACSTTHGSDEALQINKDDDSKYFTLNDVHVQPKNILGLDYESSSDSEVS